MIESVTDCDKFHKENIDGDWIVHVVSTDDAVHPAFASPSILFIRNILTSKTYYYAFNHPDSIRRLDSEWILNELGNPKKTKWALDKKAFCQMIPLSNVNDVNLCEFLTTNETEDIRSFETSAHTMIRARAQTGLGVNRIIPLMKHLEMFDDLCDTLTRIIKKSDIDNPYKLINNITIPALMELESNGIYVDTDLFKEKFGVVPHKGYVYSQYNIYTSTGRPSNRFGGVNYAALNHSDGSRECFCSRYGNDGRMVMIDYTAFHPRIICKLVKYPLAPEVDIYEYLARLYFQKKDVDETDIANAKQLTFRQLYGGVEDKYSHIKYLSGLKSYINEQWEFFKTHGYVLTPLFKRKITDKHIQDPNPNKLFNYILQAVEGEVAIPKLKEVLEYLRTRKTKAILYTYDSILYDFHREDGENVLTELRNIMSGMGTFPMKTYVGRTYQDLQLI